MDENKTLGKDAAEISFIWEKLLLAIDVDLYLGPKSKNDAIIEKIEEKMAKNGKLIFHIGQFTDMQRLCIPPKVATKVIAIAYGDKHLDFTKCYKIIAKSWYIHGLVKYLHFYIKYYPQCLIL